MEDEVHIGEILAILWREKYLIMAVTAGAALIALGASILFITPLFEAKASFDPAPYDISSERLLARLDQPDLIDAAAEKLDCGPDDLAETALEAEEGLILVTVKAPEAALSLRAVEALGKTLFERAAELRREELAAEKRSLLVALAAVEEELYTYSPDLSDYYEELVTRKKSLQSSLEMIDQYIEDDYRRLDHELQQLAMEVDQRYIALFEQKGRLMAELAETRALIRKAELGLMTETLREQDLYYSYLVEQKDRYRTLIEKTAFRLDDLEQRQAAIRAENYIYMIEAPCQPVNVNWPLNTAVAAVLGLMVAILIVFMKPFFRELKEELKEEHPEQEPDQGR